MLQCNSARWMISQPIALGLLTSNYEWKRRLCLPSKRPIATQELSTQQQQLVASSQQLVVVPSSSTQQQQQQQQQQQVYTAATIYNTYYVVRVLDFRFQAILNFRRFQIQLDFRFQRRFQFQILDFRFSSQIFQRFQAILDFRRSMHCLRKHFYSQG